MGEKVSQKKKPEDNFSVALGLLDYVNPIFYSVTSYTIAKNMQGVMSPTVYKIFVIGAILSLIFGFTIPTGKLIVGLGLIKFVMPVILVLAVNTGIFLSGCMLFYTVFKPAPVVCAIALAVVFLLLAMIYSRKKKFNTIAVLIGAVGYLLIYSSMIALSLTAGLILPVVCYCGAICLFVFLCMIGIKANLMDARVHWVIESCNVLCQFLVAVGTVLAFR